MVTCMDRAGTTTDRLVVADATGPLMTVGPGPYP